MVLETVPLDYLKILADSGDHIPGRVGGKLQCGYGYYSNLLDMEGAQQTSSWRTGDV